MQSGEITQRFGRCPYCRAMVSKNLDATVFHRSRCQTPIRGMNSKPTDDHADRSLSRSEVCHMEASVLDDDGDRPPLFNSSGYCSYFNANSQGVVVAPAPSSPFSPYGAFSSARRVHPHYNGARRSSLFDEGIVGLNEHGEIRRLSRRTRQPWSSDSSVLRYGVFKSTDSEELSSSRNACERRRQRSRPSLMGSEDLEMSMALSTQEPPRVAASPPADAAFHHRELRFAQFKLRGLLAATEPASSGETAAARRDARFFRRLESCLSRALPSSAGHRERRRKGHCHPVLGGAPFVACGRCYELLQTPATTTVASRRRGARLRCGGCGEVLELAVPATMSSPAHRTTPELPLHVALGYSSPEPLLQSRRY